MEPVIVSYREGGEWEVLAPIPHAIALPTAHGNYIRWDERNGITGTLDRVLVRPAIIRRGQPKRQSLEEAILNVLIGFWVAYLAQLIVFPLCDIHISSRTNLTISGAFTFVSLARSYVLRRFFNRLQHR